MEYSFKHTLIEVLRAIQSPEVLDKVLDRHGHVEFLGVVVVLVHVQHDHGVGQPEGRVSVREWLSIRALWETQRNLYEITVLLIRNCGGEN